MPATYMLCSQLELDDGGFWYWWSTEEGRGPMPFVGLGASRARLGVWDLEGLA